MCNHYFEGDSASGIAAAENSEAKKVIVVKSSDNDYSQWNDQIIQTFSEVDRTIFKIEY